MIGEEVHFGIQRFPFTDTSRSEAAIRSYGKILKISHEKVYF